MTKGEKRHLEAAARYIGSACELMDSGRIHAGKESMEKAKVMLEVMLSLSEKKE